MNNYICKASKHMNSDVGIIVPEIIDHNLKKVEIAESDATTLLPRCITSAAIVNINAYHKVNGYDEYLFIDYVDFDFSVRVRLCGYKIIKIYDSVLDHELGKSCLKRFLFWQFRYTEHSAIREYYIARNIVVYVKRYRRKIRVTRDILSLCKHYLIILMYDKNKKEKLRCLTRGLFDGVKHTDNKMITSQ